MPTRLSGTLFTLENHFLYVGPLLRSEPHAHHAGQIMWVPDGIELAADHDPPRRTTFAVIPPDRPHAHADASLAAVLWVDGDDVRWASAEPACGAPPERSGPPLRSAPSTRSAPPLRPPLDAELPPLDDALTPASAQALAWRLLRALAPGVEPRRDRPRHPAVQRMCALLDAGSSTPSHELSLTALARRAGLSERQLRDVFVRDTGLTPRAYLRWRRLRRAVVSIREGASLTMAAMQAGFADGAHFSRVFHAQFGISPIRAFASLHFGDAMTSS